MRTDENIEREGWVDRVSGKTRKYRFCDPEHYILNKLSKFNRILEVGSGLGRYEKMIPKIAGIEYSKKFFEESVDKVRWSVFIRADGFNIPFLDNTFDCVFSSGVIEHYDNSLDMIKEHVRICREGGKVIITVPAKDTVDYERHKLYLKIMSPFEPELKDWRHYGRRMSKLKLYTLLKQARLKEIKVYQLGTPLRGRLGLVKTYLSIVRWGAIKKPKVVLLLMLGILVETFGMIITLTLRHVSLLCKMFQKYGYYLVGEGTKPPLSQKENLPEFKKHSDILSYLQCPNCRLTKLVSKNKYFICHRCKLKYSTYKGFPILLIKHATPFENSEKEGA